MAGFKVLIKPSAVKEIEAVGSRQDRRRIVAAIHALADDPHPPASRKLTGSDKYRLREGRYRIIYTVDSGVLVVFIVKVGHRREVYR